MDLPDFIKIGKELGLEGESLMKFIDKERKRMELKEKEEMEREERRVKQNQEFEIQKLDLELKAKCIIQQPNNPGFKPKLQKLTDEDNIDNFIYRFEIMMKQMNVDEKQWSFHLSTALSGESLAFFESLGEDGMTYQTLKTALLKRFRLDNDGYRHIYY